MMYTNAMTPEERARSREYTKKAHAKAKTNPKPCQNNCGKLAAPRRKVCATCRSANYRKTRSESGKTYLAEYRAKIKREAIEAYGGKCACCGEVEPVFLTLDHVDGKGNEHRKEVGKTDMWAWARRNGFPDLFQVLCFNCNFAKHWGTCPHKERH